MHARHPTLQPVIAVPGETPSFQAFGLDLKILFSTEQTGGALAALLGWHKPGQGAPDHFHVTRDEVFVIVEGVYEVTVGDRTATLGPGALVFIPHSTSHRFRNVGETNACMIDWSIPGGQDDYFKAI